MNRYIHLIGLWILALAMAGCQDEEDSAREGGTGFLISLTNDVEVTTKATPADLGEPLKEKFKLKVVNDAAPTLKYYDGNYKEGLRVNTPAGRYRLTAECGTNPALALDDPYYKGEKTEEVEEGKMTSASIPCKVANALTSVVFGEQPEGQDFTADFSDYRVEVSVKEDENHDYVAPVEIKDNGTSAYYRAGTIPTYTFIGTVKETGKPYTFPLQDDRLTNPDNFAAGMHCKIVLTMTKTEAGLKVNVSKVEINRVDIQETIPLEWLPKPKLETEGFDEVDKTTLYRLEGATVKRTAKLNINLAKGYGLDELAFSVKGDPELEGDYQLSKMTEEQKQSFKDKGIALPAIGGLNPSIDFTDATISAKANEDGSDATLSLENVVATANKRSNESSSYKLITKKIDFGLEVYPGDTWTKEFTPTLVYKSGDKELFNRNVSFEYSEDGGKTWIASSKDEAIKGLTPGKTYQARSVCLGLISEAKEVKTYSQIALENGNLSDYSIVKGEDGNRWSNYGSLFQWTSWATLNELTVDKCKWTAYSYNSRSGTRPTNDVRKGSSDNTAAWIITIGYGYGGTNDSPKLKSPGELFLGTYNTKGIDYASHPTGVKFYYKYAPFKGDKSDIYVQILHDQTVLGSGSLQETSTISDYKEYTMNINYENANVRLAPNKIILVFKSGFNTEVESRESGGLITSNTANPKFRGSELYIDDISLIYDK